MTTLFSRFVLGRCAIALTLGLIACSAAKEAAKPPVVLFTAAPDRVAAGKTAVLTWKVVGADTVMIEPGIGKVDNAGTKTITVDETITYTLTASNKDTTIALTTKVTAGPKDKVMPTVKLNVSPKKITRGENATLSWDSDNATSVSIKPDVGKVEKMTGKTSVKPENSTTYVVTAENLDGKVTDEVRIEVEQSNIVRIYFETKKTDIKLNEKGVKDNPNGARNMDVLDSMATILKKNPKMRLTIVGHADERGKKKDNEKLSKQRVEKVKAYLVKKKKIDKKRISASWASEESPASRRSNALNRSVDLVEVKD